MYENEHLKRVVKEECLFVVKKESLELVALLKLMKVLETAVLSYCHEEYRMKEKKFELTLMKNQKRETIQNKKIHVH